MLRNVEDAEPKSIQKRIPTQTFGQEIDECFVRMCNSRAISRLLSCRTPTMSVRHTCPHWDAVSPLRVPQFSLFLAIEYK